MKIILTGATGYVGEGVMLELLRTPQCQRLTATRTKKETAIFINSLV